MALVEGKRYTLSELVSTLKEGANEWKPRIEASIIKTDAQNNVKAVKDIMQGVGKLNKGVDMPERKTNPEVENDLNKTTLDYDFAVEPSKEYKERVKAQAHGYASADHEKHSKVEEENESLDFDGNKEFYKQNTEKKKKQSKAEEEQKASGLAARELASDGRYKNKTIFPTNESKKMKRLHFSHTVFLNEAQMTAKIPEDYKVDGNRFIMKDMNGTEYLVECHKHPTIDYVYTNVIQRTNRSELNEEMQRMRDLAGYTSQSTSGAKSRQCRLDEDAKFMQMMKKTRILTEQSQDKI